VSGILLGRREVRRWWSTVSRSGSRVAGWVARPDDEDDASRNGTREMASF
jgi:hypothetical protein